MEWAEGGKDFRKKHVAVAGDRVSYRCYVYEDEYGFVALNPEFYIFAHAEAPLVAAQMVAEGIIEHMNMMRMEDALDEAIEDIPSMSRMRRTKLRVRCVQERLLGVLTKKPSALVLMKMVEPFAWTDEQYA